MKLSISNIAWGKEHDKVMYQYISDQGFEGIEIAPTRLVENNPYDNPEDAKKIADYLNKEFGLIISSMQSIWFGRNEMIFGTKEERDTLIQYTKKAIKYAQTIGCKNIVFGCPRNRNFDNSSRYNEAYDFFSEIGYAAYENDVVISMEPNPTIYNTNFINTSVEAITFVKNAACPGLKVNIDLGTIIYNNESIYDIFKNVDLINHIHISEPNLLSIERRDIHYELRSLISESAYDKFVSIEMKNYNDINLVKDTIGYINEVMR